MGGAGVIASHDYVIVGSAISAFLRENWRQISFALASSGQARHGLREYVRPQTGKPPAHP